MIRLIFAPVLLLAAGPGAPGPAAGHFYDGKLSETVTALGKRLADRPGDDEARFALGVAQFLRSVEKLGAGLHGYGLRTDSLAFINPRVKKLFGPNPKPRKISYDDARKLL